MRARTCWYVIVIALSALPVLLLSDQASAQSGGLYAYPSQGQSPQKQQQDQGECHIWATQTSGYDPYSQSSSHASGGLVKGGAVGAAGGAVGGAIAGNAGKGAAIGAATGALLGGVRQHQHNQSVDARTKRGQSEYQRALRACLEGRGYSVN